MTPEEKIAAIETELAAVKKNRDSILREKRELEGRSPGLDPEMAARRQQMRDLGVSTGIDDLPPTDRVVVPRHADPAAYREAKARAEKLGVPLVFSVEGPGDPTQRGFVRDANSRVKYVETDGVLYANREMLSVLGVAGLNAEAEKRSKRLSLFRSIDDLPAEAQAKHARILEGGDPDQLLFEGGA